MEHQALERLAPLGNDEQAHRRPTGDERLLHRAAPRDQFLVAVDEPDR